MYKNMLDGNNNHHVVPPNATINLTGTSSPSSSSSTASSEIDMDDIFIKISELYTDEIFKIIHHTLLAIKNDENNYMYYADGLNMILQPVNVRIKKWIDENKIEDHVFLFSESSLSNFMVHQLYEHNDKNSYIDIGTTLNHMIGMKARRGYHLGNNKICIW